MGYLQQEYLCCSADCLMAAHCVCAETVLLVCSMAQKAKALDVSAGVTIAVRAIWLAFIRVAVMAGVAAGRQLLLSARRSWRS
jgi:hypothetical protein